MRRGKISDSAHQRGEKRMKRIPYPVDCRSTFSRKSRKLYLEKKEKEELLMNPDAGKGAYPSV